MDRVRVLPGTWSGYCLVRESVMKPYYEDETTKLYCGDCRDIIPQLGGADLVLTDPPYGVNGGSGTKGKDRSNKSEYLSFDDSPRLCTIKGGCTQT